MNLTQRKMLVFVIMLVWVGASAILLWYYFGRPLRPFATYQALDHIGRVTLDDALSQSTISLVHFEDPDCQCARYSQLHVRDLIADYPDYAHFIVDPSAADSVKEINSLVDIPIESWVPSSPSVAIFSKDGEILYYGSYSAGAVCGEGFDFVREVLTYNFSQNDKLNSNTELELNKSSQWSQDESWKNLSAYGCYCDWPNFNGGG